jgi:hypothetical protein
MPVFRGEIERFASVFGFISVLGRTKRASSRFKPKDEARKTT